MPRITEEGQICSVYSLFTAYLTPSDMLGSVAVGETGTEALLPSEAVVITNV